MDSTFESLPRHDHVGRLSRTIEVLSLVGSVCMVLLHLLRFSTISELFRWWLPVVLLAALLFADFASGFVHWFADTWGSETMPILGRRLFHPFRVHHVNPNDILRRDFINLNGDVAMIACTVLSGSFLIPLTEETGQSAALFLVGSAVFALPTNQFHQWAHTTQPPSWVRCLQRCRLILRQEQHQVHHIAPYAKNYCITTGWCNRMLTTINFFPALEWLISRLTGLSPRGQDLMFVAEFVASTGKEGEATCNAPSNQTAFHS